MELESRIQVEAASTTKTITTNFAGNIFSRCVGTPLKPGICLKAELSCDMLFMFYTTTRHSIAYVSLASRWFPGFNILSTAIM